MKNKTLNFIIILIMEFIFCTTHTSVILVNSPVKHQTKNVIKDKHIALNT